MRPPRNNKQTSLNKTRLDLFLEKVIIPDNPDDCYLWIGAGGQGIRPQGAFWNGEKTMPAYRWYYQYLNDVELPSHIYVCHTCDNEMCVNPKHLFTGTVQDNTRDAVIKGRMVKGSSMHTSKLNEIQVQVIKEALREGHLAKVIAKYFNVRPHTISNIKTGRTWKHVTID